MKLLFVPMSLELNRSVAGVLIGDFLSMVRCRGSEGADTYDAMVSDSSNSKRTFSMFLFIAGTTSEH